ncbi:hypothetical protein AWB67_07064 [Caballeronia terrestris]|uniref:Uncharacterized protein n=1 Tax=Caballeronia terrestris TaxID=1226301 RepID=A0A158KZS9_9BURK|nr:hypothetical protein AWB67_07064 [Caballeronia terrestris]
MDFDAPDQPQNDLALHFKIDRIQPFGDGVCKFLEPVDDQEQLALHHPMATGFLHLPVNLFEPVLQLLYLRLEVRLVDNAVSVAVDQPGLAFFQLKPLLFQTGRVEAILFIALHHVQSTFIFVLQSIRMPEQFNDLLPYQIIKSVGSYLEIVTDAVAAETVSIGSNTAVISVVPLMPLGCSLAHFLCVIGVTALAADRQPLQQA